MSGPQFDMAVIREAVEQVDADKLAPIIKKAADEFYCTVLETAQDYLQDNLDWNLKSHVQMLERENQRMRDELYQVDRVLGPPWLTAEERVKRARSLDEAYAQLMAIRHELALHPSEEVRKAFEHALAKARGEA